MLELSFKTIIGIFGAAVVFIPAGAAIISMFMIVFEQIKEIFYAQEHAKL